MGFSAREFKIFRKTLPTDTFTSLSNSEKLAFNANGTDNKVVNGWTTGFRIGSPRDIAKHDNPNENLAEQQDTGLDENTIEIKGVIARADIVTNIFMANLVEWQNEGAQESNSLPFGKFAFDLNRAPFLSQKSNATTGMEIRSLSWDILEDTPNSIEFTLILSKGQGS